MAREESSKPRVTGGGSEGRDPSATIDSALGGSPGFQNEGDNEITGFHVSNGNATRAGILGMMPPHLFEDGWRAFYTAQHGDNVTWEILPGPEPYVTLPSGWPSYCTIK